MPPRRHFPRPQLVSNRAGPEPARAEPASRSATETARAFRDLVLPHLDAAYNFACYLSRDQTAAQDIVQDAFLRAFRSFGSYRGGEAKAWLFAIVRNCFLDWAAGRKGDGRVLVDADALGDEQTQALRNIADNDHETPEDTLIRRREIETIRAVIGNLPEPFRETLVLRELEELSYKEIAAAMSMPIGTVMSRLARAREMLANMMLPHSGRREAEARP